MSVAISGADCWSCFGRGRNALLDALVAGRSGRRRLDHLTLAGDAWLLTNQGMPLSGGEEGRQDLGWPARVAVETALGAWHQSGLVPGHYRARRLAVVAGSSQGSAGSLLAYLGGNHGDGDAERFADSGAAVVRAIARRLDARGPGLMLNTGCSSGLHAVGQAAELIAAGVVDCALAGGHDLITPWTLAGFNNLRLLDPAGGRPFAPDAAGLSLGDGAGYFVLERADEIERRGGRILAHVSGYATACEGRSAESERLRAVMAAALAQDPAPEELAYVSASATGVANDDRREAAALERLAASLQVAPVVASLKGQAGHALGGSGPLQVAALIAAMERAQAPGTAGLHAPPAGRLRFPATAAEMPIPLALCNSFGFGGSLASLALRPPRPSTHSEER